MSATISERRLSETAILNIMRAAIQEARRAQSPSGIAVIDPAGTLRAWMLIDGASPFAFEAALKKAKTAAITGIPSGAMPPDLADRLMVITDFVNLRGGLPIKKNGRVIGAIAVGGGTEENDVSVAQAGLLTLDLQE
jgi:uncharacterized protein GlcG (DUF336 family)